MEPCRKKCDDTKMRLIEAAGEVFAQRGYQAATIRDICGRAGANVGAVNYHFRDKDGLYAAVIAYAHQLSEQVYPLDLGMPERPSAEDRLRAFIRALLLRMLSDGLPTWHGKLMAQEIANPTDAISQAMWAIIGPEYRLLSGILSEMLYGAPLDEDAIDDTTFLCAMSVLGQCVNFFTSRHFVAHFKPVSFDPKDVEAIAEHIVGFTLAGMAAKRAEIEGRRQHERV